MQVKYEVRSNSFATWLQKVNILYHIYCHFSTYSPATSMHFFLLVFSAAYALKIDFSVLTLKPQQRSSVIHRLQTRPHEDGTSDFLLGNNHWEPSGL